MKKAREVFVTIPKKELDKIDDDLKLKIIITHSNVKVFCVDGNLKIIRDEKMLCQK